MERSAADNLKTNRLRAHLHQSLTSATKSTQGGHEPASHVAVAKLVYALSKHSFEAHDAISWGADVRRREFLGVLGAAATAWPLSARAQQGQRVRRVGVLWPGASAPASPRLESFRTGLREAGYIEGQNLTIELRYSRRGSQHLPELAAELVRLNVEVIQASGDYAPKIAQQATDTIPILAFTDDVLGAGLVASLSRPGGNTTGLTILAPELSAKRLEILSEIVPGLSRVAALWDPTSGISQVSMTEIAARAKNIQLQVLKVQHRDDLAEAFATARKGEAQAVNVFASPFLSSLSGEIIGIAAAHRVPTIYQWKENVENGGLVSYGPSLVQLWRQAGNIAAKLLKGAKPADMPVEQPTKFELVVNTRTAKAIGINLPPSLLVRADEVVD
jgi:putative ABC transport system substrate-binding protein